MFITRITVALNMIRTSRDEGFLFLNLASMGRQHKGFQRMRLHGLFNNSWKIQKPYLMCDSHQQ